MTHAWTPRYTCVQSGLRFFVEQSLAARRQSHHRLAHGVCALDPDKAFCQGILPDRMPGTCAPPGLHGLLVGARTAVDPGEKFQHQETYGLRHRWFPLLK